MYYYAETEQNLINLEQWTLEWINETFVPLGLTPIQELPKGIPMDGSSCVLGKVLNDGLPCKQNKEWWVGTKWVDVPDEYITNPEEGIEMPLYVQEFVEAFDDGCYPDLQDKPEDNPKVPQRIFDPYTLG